MRASPFICAVLLAPSLLAQKDIPAWCRELPRAEYQSFARVAAADPWFEVYRIAPGTFAIYEPHQSEETISYLILGNRQGLLFDSGMGIGDLKRVVNGLTKLPVAVLNSHTHQDHVGGNWQFATVYGMDTDFTRRNALGSREAAQGEIAPGEICGSLPARFDREAYATKPWKIGAFKHDGDRIKLGGRTLEVVATPGHTPDAVCLLDRANSLLFTGDTYYPGTIYLWAKETDLDAYGASVRRLAALAPEIRSVLGAHNVPGASPSVLPRLAAAFEGLRAGRATLLKTSDGAVRYEMDGFRFRVAAPLR